MDILLKTAPAYDKSNFDNLLSPENVQSPFLLYARLRDESPVHWNAHFGSWLLTRYSDVRDAFADRERFLVAVGDAMLLRANDFPSVSASITSKWGIVSPIVRSRPLMLRTHETLVVR